MTGTTTAEEPKAFQDATAVFDSAGICIFTSFAWTLADIQPQIDAACEGDWSMEKLNEVGERIWNLERQFNLAAGFTAKDDDLPEGTTVDLVIERFGLPRPACKLVLIDGLFVPPAERASRALKDGETLAIWPPVAGGCHRRGRRQSLRSSHQTMPARPAPTAMTKS